MSRTSKSSDQLRSSMGPSAGRRPRALRATWTPTTASKHISFIPWEEMIEPRFPRPPKLPRDLKAPAVDPTLDDLRFPDE
jgi:hypothetical protein